MEPIRTEKKEDLRVRKTKRALIDVFRVMLSEKKFEDITVNELCDRAGIRRATFYKHFDDKYNFLTFVIYSLRDDFDRQVWAKKIPETTAEYYAAYVRGLVSFVNCYDKTFDGIMQSDVSHHLVSILMEENYKYTKERLSRSASEGMKLPASPEILSSMLTGGLGHVIVSWIKSGKQKPVDELFAEISAIIARLEA